MEDTESATAGDASAQALPSAAEAGQDASMSETQQEAPQSVPRVRAAAAAARAPKWRGRNSMFLSPKEEVCEAGDGNEAPGQESRPAGTKRSLPDDPVEEDADQAAASSRTPSRPSENPAVGARR